MVLPMFRKADVSAAAVKWLACVTTTAPQMKKTLLFFALAAPAIVSLVSFCRRSEVSVRTILEALYRQHLYAWSVGAERCTKDSALLPKYDVIVGGYRYKQDDRGTPLDTDHYIWNLNLPGATIFWYRRVEVDKAPFRMSVPGSANEIIAARSQEQCTDHGHLQLEERVLPANRGRDPAAFVDHVLQIYDSHSTSSFPDYLLFLHGHLAQSHHTSCESIFSRSTTHYKYASLNASNQRRGIRDAAVETKAGHMMTFTGSRRTKFEYNKTLHKLDDWDDVRHFQIPKDSQYTHKTAGFDTNEDDSYTLESTMTCADFYGRYLGDMDKVQSKTKKQAKTCCASFVVPAQRIYRFHKQFWEDLMKVHMRPTDQDRFRGRYCFEFIIYTLLGDEVPDNEKNHTTLSLVNSMRRRFEI